MDTPCVSICVMDPVSGLCEGCSRSLQEIAVWGTLTPHERRAIMADLPARKSVNSTQLKTG